MRAANSFFLVIKANSKSLTMKEVWAIDETGKYIPPLHSEMSTYFPGWGAFRCHDQNNETHCNTRLGDRDPWLEIEYSLENGVGEVGLINYGTEAHKATVAIYKDHEWKKLLWEGRFEGDKDVQSWESAFSFPLLHDLQNVK